MSQCCLWLQSAIDVAKMNLFWRSWAHRSSRNTTTLCVVRLCTHTHTHTHTHVFPSEVLGVLSPGFPYPQEVSRVLPTTTQGRCLVSLQLYFPLSPSGLNQTERSLYHWRIYHVVITHATLMWTYRWPEGKRGGSWIMGICRGSIPGISFDAMSLVPVIVWCFV
jgi:hypothetical protein